MSTELKNSIVVCTVSYPKNSTVNNEKKEKKLSNKIAASNRWFKCNVCKKVFDRKSSIVLHERTHLDDRPLTCKVCQKTFIDKSQLIKHIPTHDNEKFTICGRSRNVERPKNLSAGNEEEFANKTFKCHICIETFKEESTLKNHLLLHSSSNRDSCIQSNTNGQMNENNNCHKMPEIEAVSTHDAHKKSLNACKNIAISDIELNNIEKVFKCNVCQETFKTEDLLIKHCCAHEKSFNSQRYSKSHENKQLLIDCDKSFVCNVCQKMFESENLLAEHFCSRVQLHNNKATVSKKKTLQLRTRRKQSHLYADGQSNCTGKKSFVCCKCQETFQNKSSLSLHFCTFKSMSHMKTYNRASKSLKCDISNETLQDKSLFKVSQHAQQFVCDICKQHFINEDALTSHRHCHIGSKFVCDDCHTAFDTRKLLGIHRRSIIKKQFVCNICQMVFCCEENLNNHHDVHNRKENFPCNVCNKIFASKFILYVHYYSHTKNVPFFICSVCLEIFSGRNDWVSHCCMHTGTKPFICEICKKYFVKRRNLYLHCRIHTDEKPYICEICSKPFKYYNTMVMHKHVHDRRNL